MRCAALYRLYGVNSRDAIGTSLNTGHSGFCYMSDVRRHLSYYWYMYTALNAGCELLYQLWALTYIATHALVFHLWTREV